MSASQEHWVARPGELILPSHAVSRLATRVGGLPVYPEGCQTPSAELTACQACGKQMALLLQAHAPLSLDQVDVPQASRFLYLFGCTAEGCGKQPGCWRALRVTAPDVAASSSSAASGRSQKPAAAYVQQDEAPVPAADPARGPGPALAADNWGVGSAADDWGVGGNDDWGSYNDACDAPAAAFDFGDLNAALDAVGSTAAAKVPARQAQGQARDGSSGSSGKAASVYDAAHPSLPAFYIYAEPESHSVVSSGSGGSARPKQMQAEQKHLQQLVARYEQEQGAGAAASSASAGAGAAACTAACTPSIEGSPESWRGERYEEDGVLVQPGSKRAAVGAAFFKFSKQLARCPDQCARYSFGGHPLWPSSQALPEPQPCGACGGPRVFELQLMTPLIPALAESAEWLVAEAAAGAAAVLQPADSWQWLTICLNSCRASCCGTCGSGLQLCEEEVVLVNEE